MGNSLGEFLSLFLPTLSTFKHVCNDFIAHAPYFIQAPNYNSWGTNRRKQSAQRITVCDSNVYTVKYIKETIKHKFL
jgi:hypothetical protein